MKQPYYAAPTILNLRPRLDLGLPASFIHSWSKDGCSVIISSFIFIILSCRAPKVEKALYIYGQFGKNLLPCHFSNYQECLFLVDIKSTKECPKTNCPCVLLRKHLQQVKTVSFLGFDCLISSYNPDLDQEQLEVGLISVWVPLSSMKNFTLMSLQGN